MRDAIEGGGGEVGKEQKLLQERWVGIKPSRSTFRRLKYLLVERVDTQGFHDKQGQIHHLAVRTFKFQIANKTLLL